MLLRFRAANVLSFRGEMELSLLAPARGDGHPTGLRAQGKDLLALPVAAVFGANASGKTNVLAALQWMRSAVTASVTDWSTQRGIPRPYFALDPAARDEASLFEVDVALAGVRYIYGFEVSDERVETEWLHVYPRGRKQVWFERDADDQDRPFRFPSDWLKGNRQQVVQATRPDALFLTVGAQLNNPQLRDLHAWFVDNFWLASGSDWARRHRYTREKLVDAATRQRVVHLLRLADLGVLDLEVDAGGDDGPSVRLVHHGPHKAVALDFADQESLGTHHWFALLGPLLDVLDRGQVLLADELDASLHPTLVAEVLRLFRNRDANPHGAQLLCTLHDVSLLGSAHPQRPLERHEVWITEKSSTGASELYPLTDARPGTEDSLERGYLRGRYGGIPNIGVNTLAAEQARLLETRR